MTLPLEICVVLRAEPSWAGPVGYRLDGRPTGTEQVHPRDDDAFESALVLGEHVPCRLRALVLAPDPTWLLDWSIARGADSVTVTNADSANTMCDVAAVHTCDLLLVGAPNEAAEIPLAPQLAVLLDRPVAVSCVSLAYRDDALVTDSDLGAGRSVRREIAMPAVVEVLTPPRPAQAASATRLRERRSVTVVDRHHLGAASGFVMAARRPERPPTGVPPFPATTEVVVRRVRRLVGEP